MFHFLTDSWMYSVLWCWNRKCSRELTSLYTSVYYKKKNLWMKKKLFSCFFYTILSTSFFGGGCRITIAGDSLWISLVTAWTQIKGKTCVCVAGFHLAIFPSEACGLLQFTCSRQLFVCFVTKFDKRLLSRHAFQPPLTHSAWHTQAHVHIWNPLALVFEVLPLGRPSV